MLLPAASLTDIVSAGGRAAIGGGVGQIKRCGPAAPSYRKAGDRCPRIALCDRDIVDRDVADARRGGVVVGDGADALALDEGATVGRAQKVDEVGLVGLHGRVAVDGHRNGLGETAGGNAHRAARLTVIVTAGGLAVSR